MKKYLLSALCLVLAALLVAAYYGATQSNKTPSPDRQLIAFYDRLTRTIHVENTSGTARLNRQPYSWVPAKNPGFHWSPDSRYFAITFTDKGGYSWTEFTDFAGHTAKSSHLYLRKAYIQELCPEAATDDPDNHQNANIVISEWLDSTHALFKFSWPSDKPGEIISGWFTFEVPTNEITGLHLGHI